MWYYCSENIILITELQQGIEWLKCNSAEHAERLKNKQLTKYIKSKSDKLFIIDTIDLPVWKGFSQPMWVGFFDF